MIQNKAVILKKLDNLLSDFLRSYAVKRLNRLVAEERIENLRETTFSSKPQYDQMDNRFKALESWFVENAPEISREELSDELVQQVIDCVNQIGALSRGEFDSSEKREILFDRKRAARVGNMASTFLAKSAGKAHDSVESCSFKIIRSAEERLNIPQVGQLEGDNIKQKFVNSLKYQVDALDYYQDNRYHLFSIVDQLLKNIEKKPDIKTKHLAASILYFMKLNGYKVTPYVEKLRQLSRNRDDR